MGKALKILVGLMLTGGTIAGAVFASANSLGGVSIGNLGADDAAVESCDSAVTMTYTLTFMSPSYYINTVTVSDIDDEACYDQLVEVTLDGSGTAPATDYEWVYLGDTYVDVYFWDDGIKVKAEDVTGVAVLIWPQPY